MNFESERALIASHPFVVWVAELLTGLAIAALALVCLGFLALMIVGLVRWYSPVPFWDMWDAYLAAYLEFLKGDWQALFVQTNEHRIWFSDLIFALDLAFFGGRSLLLIPVNGLLAVAIWITLGLIAMRLLKGTPRLGIIAALCVGPLCLSWLQEQNLTWGFQSQFFVVYLFPLAAFSCLAMSYGSERSRRWFVAAVAFGLASLGTMANGLLVLPLLIVMIVLMPHPDWRRAGSVFGVGAVAVALWFQDYFLVARDVASLSQMTTFVLTFFGLPLTARFIDMRFVHLGGAFFICASLVFALRWIFARGGRDPMALALVAFLAYVGASCAMIAFGRAAIEPNAALVSRYATPSLVGWSVLAILSVHALRNVPFVQLGAAALGLLVGYGLLPAQRLTLGDVGPEIVHRRMAAALALKMRVMDFQIISNVYPTDTKDNVNQILRVARESEKRGLSIMSDAALTAAAGRLGRPATSGFHSCRGVVHRPEAIEGEPDFFRLTGWMFDAGSSAPPAFAYVEADGVIEGVVVSGRLRRDVAETIDARALEGGFTGYLRAPAASADLRLVCAGQ